MGESDGKTSPADSEQADSPPASGPAPKPHSSPAPRAKPDGALVRTLLTGASFQSTWRMRGMSDPPPEPAAQPPEQPVASGSDVRELSRPATGSDEVLSLADTQAVERTSPGRRRSGYGGKFAQTLRMQLGVGQSLPPDARALAEVIAASAAEAEPEPGEVAAQADAPAEVTAAVATAADSALSAARRAGNKRPTPSAAAVLWGTTQRIGDPADSEGANARAAARATDPFGIRGPRSTKPLRPARGATRVDRGLPTPPPAAGRESSPPELGPQPRSPADPSPGFDAPGLDAQRAQPFERRTGSGADKWSSGQPTPRGLRLGAQTVLTRRGIPLRDVLFVGLLVGALGITAAMLLTLRSRGSQPKAATTTRVAPPAAPREGELDAKGPPAATAAGTEIRSIPEGAEIVFGGAVIGNTPARVAHTTFDADYLLRLPGYEPQLVRITTNSPSAIQVNLKPQH